MDKEKILREVNSLSEDLLLHYACPNNSVVIEVLQLDVASLTDLTQENLSRYILVLGQYLVMLQHQENLKAIEYMLAYKAFEFKLSKQKISLDLPKSIKTEKEKMLWVLREDEYLHSLYEEVLSLEAQKTLMSGTGRAVENLLNALKKEMSSRYE